MRIDLTPLLNGRVGSLDFDCKFKIEDAESEVLLPDGIDVTEPVAVTGSISDKNNCMFLDAHVAVRYHTLCDRCLDDIDRTMEFDFKRMVSTDAPEAPDEELLEEIIYVDESGVDIDSSLIEEIALELPMYHLCSEDCKGLCQKCGKKLADGECQCKNEKETDPRLKILQKLLDNYD